MWRNLYPKLIDMKKKILALLANGFEEIETITPIDILRRAEIEVVIASVENEKLVSGRNKISIQAETTLNEIKNTDFDGLFLPGGPGAKILRKDTSVLKLVKDYFEKNRLIAAICAAPTVLFEAGILKGKQYTAHFSTKDELTEIQFDKAVVIDKNIITSQGPGTALPFALSIVEVLEGKDLAKRIIENICYLENYDFEK